jgi:aspartyl protease family protein
VPGAVGFGLILAAMAILVATQGERDIAGLSPEQFASLASFGALALVIGSGVVHQFRGRFLDGARSLAIWGVITLAFVGLYAYREHAQDVGYRILGELAPGRAVVGQGGEVTVARRQDGGFAVRATVNGRAMDFAFDTGASTIVLSAESAAALGLAPAESAFVVSVQTANGRASAAPVMLDAVAVGPIVERRVPALVVRPGLLRTNLLGMTFLERLESYEVRGSRLILRGAARGA